jgi:hypothetical protein
VTSFRGHRLAARMLLRTYSQRAALILGLLVSGGGAWGWHTHRIGDIGGSLAVGVGSSILAAAIVAFLSPVNEAGFRRFVSLGIDDVFSSRRAINDRDWVDWVSKAKKDCVLLGIAHGNWCTDKRFAPALQDRLEQGVEFRILFLNPTTTFAADRTSEEKGKRNTADVIRDSIKTMWKIRQGLKPGVQHRLHLYVYAGTPSCGLTWVDEFMVVTHYLARVPNVACPALMVRPPEHGVENCLYETYAENLEKIVKEASIRIDDTNIGDFLPLKTDSIGVSPGEGSITPSLTDGGV